MTDARIDGVRVDVVVDTGATQTVGNLALQRALRGPTDRTAVLSSVTGHDMTVDLSVASELRIDDLKVSNVLLAYADAPAFTELGLRQRPAIFLGMRELRLFKRVAIDFETSKILFDLPA